MKRLLLIIVALIFIACSSRKQVEKAINTGNYNQAITDILNKLKTNKDKRRKSDYILLLQVAFNKANERDLNKIDHLKKDNNPELLATIYELYKTLKARQEALKPILPLEVNGQEVVFNMPDYTSNIVEARNKTANYLYQKGLQQLESRDKTDIRKAYDTFKYVETMYPNYRDVRALLDEAHFLGTDFVLVTIQNQTQQIIPKRLEADLLNFNTYGLNKFWTAYHAVADTSIYYNYAMQLQLKQIRVIPERIKERQIIRKDRIVDGWEYKKDNKGNVVKDSLGKAIKIDKIVNVRASVVTVVQQKAAQIIAEVVYTNLNTKQLIDRFTIDSGFEFLNEYATYRGDRRALTNEDLNLLNNRRMPFPSNEQMVFDTGEDLKLQLKDIINSFNF